MRWFKHLSLSSQDEKLSELLDLTGPEGYGVWWLILERIALNMDPDKDPGCTLCRLSVKSWASFCRISAKKLQKYIRIMSELQLTFVKYEKINPLFLTISAPNIAKYRDEYTKRKERSTDKVRIKSAQSTDTVRPKIQSTDTDADADTDKEKKRTPTGSAHAKKEDDKADNNKKGQKQIFNDESSSSKSNQTYFTAMKKTCNAIYRSYFKSAMPCGKEMPAQLERTADHFKLELGPDGKPLDTEGALRLLAVAFEAFCMYEGWQGMTLEEARTDTILKHDHSFGCFAMKIARWVQEARGSPQIYMPLETPGDVLKLNLSDGRAKKRIEAYTKRNPEHQKLITDLTSKATTEGLTYEKYQQEKNATAGR